MTGSWSGKQDLRTLLRDSENTNSDEVVKSSKTKVPTVFHWIVDYVLSVQSAGKTNTQSSKNLEAECAEMNANPKRSDLAA